ncbi:MAG: hypothetical protein M0P91_04080 [Sulfuricurvum sp.]|jgi:hypothetical protein|uniref:hypothetical protein n=1 Tax=Sulfuricurvum sp. TaxID=2025608 RepID=UPI0025FF7EED|nr:hypothetical protein [Sulfuricurvum sp.]MCK9372351.1 hypothetical protein [Sulfuricurvum sp.]
MKYTPTKILISAVVSTFITAFVAEIWVMQEESALSELYAEQKNLAKQAKEYEVIKGRWFKEESKMELNELKNHPNLSKEEKRGKGVYLEYDNLSSVEFNRLSNKILNSMLMIKKLTLRRNEGSKGTINVEFEG